MHVVIDANIFFAALLKHGYILNFIFSSSWNFYFPEAVILEYEEHKEELIKKSKLSEDELDRMMHFIGSYIQLISDDVLSPYVEQANEIIKSIDPDDMPFIACALAIPESILWSNDKDLKEQKKVIVVNTEEIIKLRDKIFLS